MPSTQASELTTPQKGLNILQEVFGLKLEKYTITTQENNPEFPWFGDTQLEDISYILTSKESKLHINLFFTNGNLYSLYVFENQGVSELKQATNNLASAQTFLTTYQKYSTNPLFGELKASLDTIDVDKNYTKTTNDKVLEITVYENTNKTVFKWYYTTNGATAPYTKVISLSFTDGYITSFNSKWDLYPIGSTEVTLSREDAIEVALETAKHHNWTVPIGADVFDPLRFNPTQSISWISLNFDGSRGADNPRSKNILELYPVWLVGIVFNEAFGELYGVEVAIWADTHEVRSVREEYSALAAEWLNSNAEEGQTNQYAFFGVFSLYFGSLQFVVLGVFMGVVSVFLVVLFRRRQSLGLLQLRRVSAKVFAVLFASLLFLMIFLPLVETVSASNAGVIWGSRSTGAQNSPNHSWRKTNEEIDKQSHVQNYLVNNCFNSANGYAGFPNMWMNRVPMLSQAQFLSSTYDSVAVVHFDHGVIGYPGQGASPSVPWGEEHYMFEDDWGTVVGPIGVSSSDWSHGVFDVDIYDVFAAGKVHFAFINTCYSANIHHLGQGFSASGHPLSLPFAFTHRLTEYSTSSSASTTMSYDGYNYPDAFPQCYIGFPLGSASLDQKLPFESAGPQWYEWVTFFFYKALNDNVSVKSALDWASKQQWSCDTFDESVLYTGFKPVWPTFNVTSKRFDDIPNEMLSTLAVYGNSDICLKNFVAPHVVAVPSISSAWKSDVGVALYFNVASVDSYGHKVRYIFDWGDGTTTTTGYSVAGVSVSVPHVWNTAGVYDVKVYAQCAGGGSSSWTQTSGAVIGNFYWLSIDTATNQVAQPSVDVWVDGVWVGSTYVYCLVPEGWHSVEVDEDIAIWEFVELSDGYANGASRPIYSDTHLTALYYCGGK